MKAEKSTIHRTSKIETFKWVHTLSYENFICNVLMQYHGYKYIKKLTDSN